MQERFATNQINFNARGPQVKNANALMTGSKTAAQNKMSFANELIKVQQNAAQARNKQDLPSQEEILVQERNTPHSTPKLHANIAGAFQEAVSNATQNKLKQLEDHELVREVRHLANQEEATKESHELHAKFNASEATMATAVQEHGKQVTEAVREGNLAQAETQYDHSKERKKQLANWEELAPRIIEDPKNRAVRIDIPGMVDLETIIVRIKQGEVSIQAVGEKNLMNKLQSSEALLNKKLREQNIQLGTLQAFDSAVVAAGAQRKQA